MPDTFVDLEIIVVPHSPDIGGGFPEMHFLKSQCGKQSAGSNCAKGRGSFIANQKLGDYWHHIDCKINDPKLQRNMIVPAMCLHDVICIVQKRYSKQSQIPLFYLSRGIIIQSAVQKLSSVFLLFQSHDRFLLFFIDRLVNKK